jgi:hypothetical protein
MVDRDTSKDEGDEGSDEPAPDEPSGDGDSAE